MTHNDELKAFAQAEYGQAAVQAKQGRSSSCCGIGTVVRPGQLDPITANLYEGEETAMVPEAAVRASLGWETRRPWSPSILGKRSSI